MPDGPLELERGEMIVDSDVDGDVDEMVDDAVEEEETLGTVVVIDDEKSVVNLLRSILEMDGYVVYEALTGQLGLGAVDAVDPDVVLLDVMMPYMDGVEVCRHLKEKRPELPVIILTSRDDRELETRCYEAGADSFLNKPLLPGQLTELVGSFRPTAN